MKVWDAATGNEIATLPATAITGLAWHPAGKLLATAGDNESVEVWNVSDQTKAYELRGRRGAVYSVAWSPDGTRLATSGSAGNIKIWKPKQQVELLNLEAQETDGAFTITDPKLRSTLYEYWTTWNHGPFLTDDKEQIRSEFLELEVRTALTNPG